MPVDVSSDYMQQTEPINIDKLIEAVIQQESSGNPKAVSRVGARGLMQIMPNTLKEYNQMNKGGVTLDSLFNPHVNKYVGTWYLTKRIPQMLKYYGIPVTPETMLQSYNAGIGRVKNNIMPDETKDYITKVMNNYRGNNGNSSY